MIHPWHRLEDATNKIELVWGEARARVRRETRRSHEVMRLYDKLLALANDSRGDFSDDQSRDDLEPEEREWLQEVQETLKRVKRHRVPTGCVKQWREWKKTKRSPF